GRGGRADRGPERAWLRRGMVSRAADDPAGNGLHRDHRRARLRVRQHSARVGSLVYSVVGGRARSVIASTQVRLMRGVFLPLTLLVVWQAWGTATGNPRTPVPTRIVAAAVELIGSGDLPLALVTS